LQLIAPLIHAHAFGLDNHLTHEKHMHKYENVVINQLHISHLEKYSSQTDLQQAHLQDVVKVPQVMDSVIDMDSVIKVSDGVKRDGSFNLEVILIVCLLIVGLLANTSKLLAWIYNTLHYQQRFYSPHGPRAPPL
jgi:hypothetical protein